MATNINIKLPLLVHGASDYFTETLQSVLKVELSTIDLGQSPEVGYKTDTIVIYDGKHGLTQKESLIVEALKASFDFSNCASLNAEYKEVPLKSIQNFKLRELNGILFICLDYNRKPASRPEDEFLEDIVILVPFDDAYEAIYVDTHLDFPTETFTITEASSRNMEWIVSATMAKLDHLLGSVRPTKGYERKKREWEEIKAARQADIELVASNHTEPAPNGP